MLFDTHAHYDDERFDEDRDTLLASMPENNVGLILNPAVTWKARARRSATRINIHLYMRQSVFTRRTSRTAGRLIWRPSRALAQNESKVRAIGEIGLDYYWKKTSVPRARQQVVFARQMESWRVHCTSLSSCMTAMRTPTAWRSPVGIRM